MKRRRAFFTWRRKPTLMDRVEEWLPEEIAARIPDQVEQALRKRLDRIDLDKLEARLSETIGSLDRAKLDELVHAGLEAVQTHKLGKETGRGAARLRSAAAGVDRQALEQAIRTRIDAIVPDHLEQMLRERMAAVTPAKAPAPVGKPAPVKPVPRRNPLGSLIGGTTRLALLAAGAWVAYSYFMVEHQVPLPKALAADQTTLAFKPTGPLCLYRDTTNRGRPLLLVHSVNAAASAYEMRPVFEHFRASRPTYALDLPGFGFSARADVEYTTPAFVQAIITAAEAIAADNGKQAPDIVALSLGAEFAAEAARQRPDLIRSLVLLSPSGLQAESAPRRDQWLYPVLTFGVWARPIFDLLTTQRSIRFFLEKSFAGEIPPGMVDYAYATSHQPDAEYAPLAFVSGRLFTPNATQNIYRKVEQPVLVIYDTDAFVRFDRLPELVATMPNWQSARITPTQGLPHWEKTAETNQTIADFLNTLG